MDKTLTDLQTWGCGLHQNAFGGCWSARTRLVAIFISYNLAAESQPKDSKAEICYPQILHVRYLICNRLSTTLLFTEM